MGKGDEMAPVNDDTTGLRLLGSGSMPPIASEPRAELLETFPNRFPDRLYVVSLNFPEYTSLCPVTGQPDFGAINVAYIPGELCVESKSFKLYMFAYRGHRSFMETIVNSMLTDLVAVLRPHWCRVLGVFASRGGVGINVSASHWGDASGPARQVVADFMADALASRRKEPSW